VAIDFLEGLIKDSASAKANLKNISNVTISWGKVLSKEIPKEKQFTETGKVRKISPQCYSALLDLNEKKALEGKVFVIQRAALATGAKYTFNRKTDAKIEANIDWKKKLTFKPNVKIHRESDYSLIIDEARYIGFIAVAIEKWLPERAFTGPSATVKAFFIPVIKMESLLR